jgi:hypothetical protein
MPPDRAKMPPAATVFAADCRQRYFRHSAAAIAATPLHFHAATLLLFSSLKRRCHATYVTPCRLPIFAVYVDSAQRAPFAARRRHMRAEPALWMPLPLFHATMPPPYARCHFHFIISPATLLARRSSRRHYFLSTPPSAEMMLLRTTTAMPAFMRRARRENSARRRRGAMAQRA